MIQPIDIKTQNFKKGLMGYKPSDVDTFKDMVYRAYDELYKEHAANAEKLEKINAALQEKNVKIFELEGKIAELEGKGTKTTSKASTTSTAAPKAEPKKEEPKKEASENKTNASAKFFKKSDAEAPAASGDDDEIFVGEIEEARKPDRMMIGDGEEEEDMDFEFL